MYKKYYSRFLTSNPHIQHYASHSHHYWPDVTREATLQYWDDSAKLVDAKWDYLFSEKIPSTQRLIAEVLNLSHPEQIVFSPNTHEFVYRLLSCFPHRKKLKILTTDSEFYSFDRQINRLCEEGMVEDEKISTQPFDDFEARFKNKITTETYDMIFFSQVFFNSGMAVKNLNDIVESVSNQDTMIVVDGYHGFMALPTDLSQIENKIFYLSGSYKYAQGGEGCCFLVVPKHSTHKPLYTGWFAGFDSLAHDGGNTGYSNNGLRFAGSTMDFSALYRLESVLNLFKKENITVDKIHSHIQFLQENFRNHLFSIDHHYLCEKNILNIDYKHHGHFLTFAMPSLEHAKKLHDDLRAIDVITDYRGNKLRFGFGLYQNDCIDLSKLR